MHGVAVFLGVRLMAVRVCVVVARVAVVIRLNLGSLACGVVVLPDGHPETPGAAGFLSPVPEVVSSIALVPVVEAPTLKLNVDNLIEIGLDIFRESGQVHQLGVMPHREGVRRVVEVVVNVRVIVLSPQGAVITRSACPVFEGLGKFWISEI